MAQRPHRRVLLVVIAAGWVLFLALFAVIASGLALPVGYQVTMLVVVLTLLIYLVGKDTWRDDR